MPSSYVIPPEELPVQVPVITESVARCIQTKVY